MELESPKMHTGLLAQWLVRSCPLITSIGDQQYEHRLQTFRPDINMADTITKGLISQVQPIGGTEVFGVARKGTRKQTSILAQKTIFYKLNVNYGVTYSENKSSVIWVSSITN